MIDQSKLHSVCLLFLLLTLFGNGASTANGAKPLTALNWTLQWSDEFNGEAKRALNTNDWIYDIGTSYPGGPAHWGTGQVESNTDNTDNIYQNGNGSLVIKAIYTGRISTSRGASGWTSGRVETVRSDFQPPAGKAMAVEARIQLPNVTGAAAQGYWPAFWMLGASYRDTYWNWPSVGEFDILENINGQNKWYGTFHCGINPDGPCNETSGISASAGGFSPTLQSAYHTYRFEFDKSVSPQQLRWYVDSVQRHTVKASQVDATTWDNATNHGFFVMLNLAIGGGWPGSPTAKTASGKFMLVDYVRVYYSE